MTDIMPGPCCVCGGTAYPLSCGGPTICPKCDCGNFDAATVFKQAEVIERLQAENAKLRTVVDELRSMETIERLRAALNEIIRIKDDTLGPRGGIEPPVGQEHFDRGCRMAFYRCAEIARKALGDEQREDTNGRL